MIWRSGPQCSDILMAYFLLCASFTGTEGIRDAQWQRQGQLSHADLRRELRQVSVDLPILGQLEGAPSSSPPSSPIAQGIGAIVPVAAPLLTELERSATTPGARGASYLSTAAPSPSAGLILDDHGVSSPSDQDAAASGLSNNSSAAPPARVTNAGSSTSPSTSAAARTAPIPDPAADAHAPAIHDHAANPNASPAASPSASGAANTPASPNLLSLLPDIMEVLNSEGQAGENGRSLNITVSAAAMSTNASTDDALALTGNLANATVESSPRRVDVEVTVDPVINVHGDILNVSSDQLQAAQVNAVPLPLGSIIPRPHFNQTPDDPSPPQPAPRPDPAPASGDDPDAGSTATVSAAAASVPPPHVVQFYAEETPPPKSSGSAAPAPPTLPGGAAAGHVPAEPAQARVLSSSPVPQSGVILVPATVPQPGAQPQVAGLLIQPSSDDASNGGQPQFTFLPPKPPALPANSTVPLQVVGSLLAALSNSQQSPTAPVATAPQLTGTPSSATSPLPQGAPVLDDPQIADALDALLDTRESPQEAPSATSRGSVLFPSPAARQGQAASAGSSSKHYPFDWAVVIAAVSSTATFMLLIVLLLAFASGFLPHRRRRATPEFPKSLKSAPLAPSGGGGLTPQSQSPQVAAAGRRLSRKPSSKSIGFLGHRLSSWTRPRRSTTGAQDGSPAALHGSKFPGKNFPVEPTISMPDSPDPKSEAVSVAATTGRSLGRQVSFAAPQSGPMPLRSPFADPSLLSGAQSLPRSHSGAESAAPTEEAELAQPKPDQAHRGDFPLPIISPFANAAAPVLPTPHVRETAKIGPRNRDSDDAALQQSGGEPSGANSDAEQLSGSYPKNRWSPGVRPPPMRTPFANSVLPAFSSVSTGFSDGYTTATGSHTSGSSSLETQKRLSMIIQQAL